MTAPFFPAGTAHERAIAIPYAEGYLTGSLTTCDRPAGVVLVANDHGCGRHDPALRTLVAGLRAGGFAVVLVDLLLPEEAASPEAASHVRLRTAELAARVRAARSFIAKEPALGELPVALLGEGAGADAALLSAAARPVGVAAVIARGSRKGSRLAIASVRVPVFVSGEESPEARARSACAFLRSALPPRAATPTWFAPVERVAGGR